MWLGLKFGVLYVITQRKSQMDSRKVFCFLMQILRENHTAIQLILVTEAFLSAVYCMLWISLIFEKALIFYFLWRHKSIDDTRKSFYLCIAKEVVLITLRKKTDEKALMCSKQKWQSSFHIVEPGSQYGIWTATIKLIVVSTNDNNFPLVRWK